MEDTYWLDSFMTLMCVFTGGVGVGLLIVSQYMQNDLQGNESDEEVVEEYERSYYQEFEALEEKDHTEGFLKNLKDKWIVEDTPFGEIIMTYMADHEAFWYYAERKNVPYRVLDTVARRFAIDNDCKSVCVNYKEEFEKGKADAIAARETSSRGGTGSDIPLPRRARRKNAFATFKSYNMKKGRSASRKYIITENANRFTYKGSTSEWVDPLDLPWTETEPRKEKVGYAAFKQGEHKFACDSESDAKESSKED